MISVPTRTSHKVRHRRRQFCAPIIESVHNINVNAQYHRNLIELAGYERILDDLERIGILQIQFELLALNPFSPCQPFQSGWRWSFLPAGSVSGRPARDGNLTTRKCHNVIDLKCLKHETC